MQSMVYPPLDLIAEAGNIFDKGATLRRDCPKLANMCMVAMSASEIRVLSPKSGTWSLYGFTICSTRTET